MTIGIEAERANNPVKTGVEHYAKQLILQLAQLDSQNQYILYLRTKPEGWFLKLPKNFTVKVMPFPIFWTQLRISWEMLLHPVDVLFIPASSMPLIHPKKTVVTVHDVAFMYYPETYTQFQRALHKFEDWLVKLFAWKIITVSEATKQDFMKFWHVEAERITVIHHGYEAVNVVDLPIASSDLKLPEKYIVFIGTLQPRKNIVGLIDAFTHLKHEHPDLPHKLVIVGRVGWKPEQILAKIKANPDIIYLGHVADNDRWHILKNASLYVLPSFYEGFGMPILEAFQMNVPVATSNISSMPEAAGEAAVYFDPKNTADIKRALQMVLFDASLADDLREKGAQRLQEFGWKKCAEETLRVLTS